MTGNAHWSWLPGFMLGLFGLIMPLPADEKPNFLLLTVDTLRADYLGCYGFPDQISPAIDSLAERGTLFEDAITTIGKTGPAFISLFTSQYPPTTGARRNGIRMRPDITSLPEVLKRHGYTTAAVVSNWTLKDHLCGLGRGFDRYDDEFEQNRAGPLAEERTAPEVTKIALKWLKAHPERPLFLWVHYTDPHWPYVHRPESAVSVPEKLQRGTGRRKREGYACEVRFADHWLGAFLVEALQVLSPASTYVFFTSDHGEGLGEHDAWGHGQNCYQPNLVIPLILVGPGIPQGKRVKQPVSIIDLMPTMLGLAKLVSPSGTAGMDLNGVWERPAGNDRDRYAFADRSVVVTLHAPRKHRNPLSVCWVRAHWKVIYDFQYDYHRYYDLSADPGELRGLRDWPGDPASLPSRTLLTWFEALPKYRPETGEKPELSHEDLAKLKSLGY